MSYFKVPLGLCEVCLFPAGRITVYKVNRFSMAIPLLPDGWDINKKVWVKDYEARRRKRGTVMSGR